MYIPNVIITLLSDLFCETAFQQKDSNVSMFNIPLRDHPQFKTLMGCILRSLKTDQCTAKSGTCTENTFFFKALDEARALACMHTCAYILPSHNSHPMAGTGSSIFHLWWRTINARFPPLLQVTNQQITVSATDRWSVRRWQRSITLLCSIL